MNPKTETAPPNIAIIHARQPKDKEELAEKFKAELAKHSFDSGSSAIPLLILSPSGKNRITR